LFLTNSFSATQQKFFVTDCLSASHFRKLGCGHPIWFRNDSLVVPVYDSREHSAQLWSISFPGGNLQRITSDVSGYGADTNDFGFPLDQTRDRTTLVTLATSQIATIWLAPAAEPSSIKELATNDLALFLVAEAPDGKLWAVGGDGQLWSLNTRLDTEAQNPVDLVSGDLFGPVCSPDGRFVFYGSVEQPQKIWKVPLAGGQPSIVARVLGDQISSQIGLSPDGKLLVYGYTTFGPKLEWSVAVISAEDGSVQRTIPVQPVDGFSPDWSADGRALLFVRTTGRMSNFWEQPLHGGRPKQVTNFTAGRIFDFS
jgi:Tol biopolymer transport system component